MINFEDQNRKWGYFNPNTGETIPCQFDEASDFVNGFAIVMKDSKYGVIDETGVEIIPFLYYHIEYTDNGLFKVHTHVYSEYAFRNSENILVDESGNVLAKCLQKFLIARSLVNGLFYIVKSDGIRGIFLKDKFIFESKANESKVIEFKDANKHLIYIKDGNSKYRLFDYDGNDFLSQFYDFTLLNDDYVCIHGDYISGYGHLLGLADTNGNIILEPKYRHITFKENDIFSLSYAVSDKEEVTVDFDAKNKAFLLADSSLELSLSLSIDWIGKFHGNYAVVAIDHKFGIIDSSLSICNPCEYDFVQHAFKDTYIAKSGDKYCLLFADRGRSGGEYKELSHIDNGFFLIKDDYTYGIVNHLGEIILPLKYRNYDKNSITFIPKEKLFCIEDKSVCYFNTNGQIVIKKESGNITLPKGIVWHDEFSEGLAIATNQDDSKGVITIDGEIVVPFRFNANLSAYVNGISKVTLVRRLGWSETIEDSGHINREGKFVCRDNQDEIIISSNYMLVKDIAADVAPAYNGEKWGLIDVIGNDVSDFSFDGIEHLDGNLFKVYKLFGEGYSQYKRFGVLNAKGELIIDCKYLHISVNQNCQLSCVSNYGHNKPNDVAIYDYSGAMEVNFNNFPQYIQTKYDFIETIGDYARAVYNGKWGVINSKVNIILDFVYTDVIYIESDYAYCKDGKINLLVSLLNPEEKIIIPECDGFNVMANGMILLWRNVNSYHNDKVQYGLYNIKGQKLTSIDYSRIEVLEGGYALLCRKEYSDAKYGFTSPEGKIILDCKYPSIIPNVEHQYLKVEIPDDVYSDNERFKYYDFEGNIVMPSNTTNILLPDTYTHGGAFNDGYAVVGKKKDKVQKDDDWDVLFDDLFDEAGHEPDDENDSLWGIVNENFEEVIECQYDSITAVRNGYVIVSKEKKYGVLNTVGDVIIPIEYERIGFLGNDLFKVRLGSKWGVMNLSNEFIIEPQYQNLNALSEGIIAFAAKKSNNYVDPFGSKRRRNRSLDFLWGYIDLENNQVVEPRYTIARPFSDGVAVIKDGKTWKVVDILGNILIDNLLVDKLTDFVDGKSLVTLTDGDKSIEHTLLKNGHLLIDGYELAVDFSKIKYVGHFYNERAIISSDGNIGFIDTTGKIIIPFTNRKLSDFKDGFSYFETSGFGVQKIDADGNICVDDLKLPNDYTAAKRIDTNVIFAAKDDGCLRGVINDNLEVLIDFSSCHLDIIEDKDLGRYFVRKVEYRDEILYAYNDLSGRMFIPYNGKRIYLKGSYQVSHNSFSEGLAAVIDRKGLWGFVNEKGEEVIPCRYFKASEFKNHHSQVIIVDEYYKTGLIDDKGTYVIIPGDYDEVYVGNDVISVKHANYGETEVYRDDENDRCDSQWYPEKREFNLNGELLLSLYGKTITLPKEYDWCDDSFKEGFLSVSRDGKWGILNTRLEVVVKCEYDEKFIFNNGFAVAKQDEHLLAIKNTGEIIVDLKASTIERFADYHVIRAISQETKELFMREIRININTYLFDEVGKYLFDATSIFARVLLPSSGNYSEQKYHPTEIVPLHSDYMKYCISINLDKVHITKWGLCTRNGDVVTDACFDDIKSIGCGLITVYSRAKKLWGYADLKGKLIIDYAFDNAEAFSHGVARVRPSKSKWGLIGSNGTILTEFVYENISDFIKDECTATLDHWNKKRNQITEQGFIHITYCENHSEYESNTYLSGFNWCSDVKDNFCIVQKDNLFGIIEANGNVVLELSNLHDVKLDIVDNHIVFKKGEVTRSIDKTGGILTHTKDFYLVLPKGIHWCEDWLDGHICVESEGKWGVLNMQLEFVLPTHFKYTQCICSNKIFCISNQADKDKFSIYDIPTGTFIDLDFDFVQHFIDGYAIVSKCIRETKISYRSPIREYVYGLINTNGDLILDCTNKVIQYEKPEPIERTYYDDYNDCDYRRDSWDAMTDGMYGDMPDGFDGDYGFMGR